MPPAVVPGVSTPPGGLPSGAGGAGAGGVPNPNQGISYADPNTFYAQNATNDTAGASGTTGVQNQMNQYTAGQQALQAQLPQTLQGILTGQQQVPDTFTAPQIAFDALNHNFNNFLAPQYAATYGAGSPQGLSQQAIQNEQLAANLYQTGQGNYLNYLNSGRDLAFTSVGQQQANADNKNWQEAGGQDTLGYQGPSGLRAFGTGLGAELLQRLGLR